MFSDMLMDICKAEAEIRFLKKIKILRDKASVIDDSNNDDN